MTDRHGGSLLLTVSRLCGWVYTLSWSLSFYPQFIMNWHRRGTKGTSMDFCFLNVVGFACYTISTACLLFSPVIRAQYAERHPSAPVPTVRFNDLIYAIHSLLLVVLTFSQFFPFIWGYEVGREQMVSHPTRLLAACCFTLVGVVAALVVVVEQRHAHIVDDWEMLDLIYTISYVKLVVTLFKYMPQVWINYCTKTTAGWAIEQTLLDAMGGVTSILQLIIDASMQNNWRDINDNPVKLGLGYISLFFDVILSAQHYLVYSSTPRTTKVDTRDPSEHEPLLGS